MENLKEKAIKDGKNLIGGDLREILSVSNSMVSLNLVSKEDEVYFILKYRKGFDVLRFLENSHLGSYIKDIFEQAFYEDEMAILKLKEDRKLNLVTSKGLFFFFIDQELSNCKFIKK